jgi:hypothetical protein
MIEIKSIFLLAVVAERLIFYSACQLTAHVRGYNVVFSHDAMIKLGALRILYPVNF